MKGNNRKGLGKKQMKGKRKKRKISHNKKKFALFISTNSSSCVGKKKTQKWGEEKLMS